jgi:nickel-dependent lactate racemase
MTVLDKEQNVVAATGGDIVESFMKAVAIARRVFCVPISRKADIVVSIAKFPMDINLYQSQKAIDNGALAVKDGGTLILVSACREGIGDQEFADLLGSCSSPDQALQVIEKTYKLGYHKAAKMASVCKRMKVLAYTKLTDCQVASLFLEPVSDLQAALDGAIAEAKAKGIEKPSIILLPDGCVTVPSL